jgi:hypothetical protein
MKAFPTSRDSQIDAGMDLRDWFAGLAMQGILASDPDDQGHEDGLEAIAIVAYKTADAMMKAREAK